MAHLPIGEGQLQGHVPHLDAQEGRLLKGQVLCTDLLAIPQEAEVARPLGGGCRQGVVGARGHAQEAVRSGVAPDGPAEGVLGNEQRHGRRRHDRPQLVSLFPDLSRPQFQGSRLVSLGTEDVLNEDHSGQHQG